MIEAGALMEWLADWQFWVVAALTITLLYLARRYLHDLLKAIFFGIAYWLSRISLWVGNSASTSYDKYCVDVAAFRALEFEQRLERHQMRLTQRADVDTRRLENAAGQIEGSAVGLEGAAQALSNVNLSASAEAGVRLAISSDPDSAKSSGRIIQGVKSALASKVAEIRPDMVRIRQELPRLQQGVKSLREVGTSFSQAAEKIDRDFKEFDEAVESDDRRAIAAKESILVPFILAVLVMTIALFGVVLNFFLIQRPMADIVGDDMQIAGMSLPTAAAIVVIFLEAAAGIVLMDSLRITRLTAISELNGRLRTAFLAAALICLTLFSAFEAFLAIQRERLIELDQATQEMAMSGFMPVTETPVVETPATQESGTEGTAPETEAEPAKDFSFALWAQVILAIIIPWLLATAAIPLETVVRNLWLILQLVFHQLLVFLSIFSKVLATAFKAFGLFLIRLYDLLIFLPLAIEDMVRRLKNKQAGTVK